MQGPVNQDHLGDVLSSIRRLLAEDGGAAPAPGARDAGPLLLAPGWRVGGPGAATAEAAREEEPAGQGAEAAEDPGWNDALEDAPEPEPAEPEPAKPDAPAPEPAPEPAPSPPAPPEGTHPLPTPISATGMPTGPFGEALALPDEAALEALVSRVVREELRGELGERITRNVRKLVRREINRALAARDFDE